jgi:hypothetical protein
MIFNLEIFLIAINHKLDLDKLQDTDIFFNTRFIKKYIFNIHIQI